MDRQELIKIIEDKNTELGLRFVESDHKYFMGDKSLTLSTTRLISSGFDFTKIPNIEYYQEIGTTMHAVVEDTAKEIIEGREPVVEDVEIYAKVKENAQKLFSKFEPVLPEQIICIPKIHIDGYEEDTIGGMIDLIACYKGEYWIVDYKTSKAIQDTHKLQINVYQKILKYVYGIEINNLMLVKIDKETGDFKRTIVTLMEDDEFNEVFEELLEKNVPK